jgi:hypothetical protein
MFELKPHDVYFEPTGPATCGCFGLAIPECEIVHLHLTPNGEVALTPDGEPDVHFIHPESTGAEAQEWHVRIVCEEVNKRRNLFILSCATAAQAEHWGKEVARLLPKHARRSPQGVPSLFKRWRRYLH